LDKIVLILFVAGILSAVSVPFMIDILQTGQAGSHSIREMVKGLTEIDQITRWIYLFMMTSLLPFACFPALRKKLTPFWMKMLVFLTANAFAFGLMELINVF